MQPSNAFGTPSRTPLVPDETAFSMDPRFAAHFQKLKQVFLYINDDCNLGCEQCIYKPHVAYNNHREIRQGVAVGLLRSLHDLGAKKLTVLGGEPTLYGAWANHEPLRAVLEAARSMGYSYLRLDTNAHFNERVFGEGGLDQLDELAFSLDGYDADTNDPLRGAGTFRRIVRRIEQAVARGISCSITCCIHRDLVKMDADGRFGVEKVIELGARLGVSKVNFHDLFKAGVPMDAWTGSFDTSVEEHVAMYDTVRARIEAGQYQVDVRLPQCFITRKEFERNPRYYGYCPVKLGERVMVHSDGTLRICSNLICSSFGAGRWEGDQILWNGGPSNELADHDLNRPTPCTNRSKNRSYGDFVPLCFSFKPEQAEPVWQNLEWDKRRTVDLVPPAHDAPPIQRPIPLPMVP